VSAKDLAGLDPEDVQNLMTSRRRDRIVNMNTIRSMVHRRDMLEKQGYDRRSAQAQVQREATVAMQRRKDLQLKEQIRVQERKEKQDLALRKETRGYNQAFDIQAEKFRLQEEIKNAKTPEEKKIAALKMRKLEAEVKKAEATGTEGLTTSEELAQKKYQGGIESDILNKDKSFKLSNYRAEQENLKPNGTTYYVVQEAYDSPWYEFGFDKEPDITPVNLPKHPQTGVQLTNQDVIDSAKAAGVSPEQILKDWKVY